MKKSTLPGPVQDTIDTVAGMHATHTDTLSLSDRIADRFTRIIGRPLSAAIVILFVGLWVAMNTMPPKHPYLLVDNPPFIYLQGVIGICGLLLVIFVVSTQNRLSREGDRRATLALHMSILTEQKITKVLELMQRDRPAAGHNHPVDEHAVEMSKMIHPLEVMEAFDETGAAGQTTD